MGYKDYIKKSLLNSVKYIPHPEKMRLSASEVSSSTLEIWLKRKYDIEDKKISQATLGSLAHTGMELAFADDDDVKTEEPIEGIFNNMLLTATVDFHDTKNKIIIDWKTTKHYTGKKVKEAINKGKPLENNYIAQINHIAFILGHPEGYKYYLGMFYKDAGVDYKTGIESETFEMIEIPIVSYEQYIEYLTPKAIDLKESLNSDFEPSICKDLWPRKIGGIMTNTKCRYYCSVNIVCPYYDDGIADDTKVEW